MEWIKDIPIKPGYYWHVQGSNFHSSQLLKIEELDNKKLIVKASHLITRTLENVLSYSKEHWWAGPIFPPELPPGYLYIYTDKGRIFSDIYEAIEESIEGTKFFIHEKIQMRDNKSIKLKKDQKILTLNPLLVS